MSDTQNEPLPGEKAIKVKKAGPILLGADRYDIFEKGQKAIREFVEELFRFLIDFPGMMYLVFILTIIVAGENRDKELMLEELAVLMNTSQYTVEIQHRWVIKHLGEDYKHLPYPAFTVLSCFLLHSPQGPVCASPCTCEKRVPWPCWSWPA